ncbi:putative mitochondrial hypothetical protein [Leptomonas pyrrhocoris]|uniref:DUF2779 domain-containing protein n=1 Tax=Leptomonas pyrrhocoris TaxID=157538 RepID=A0A0M9FVV4_LEPPY|nr:putative mitochondrial hypothetical protein [Leptomonas pyrrhocoris]KPA76946.1 putative mitochondrial hypothetical protein [Leptomonas pyrrhocoris]|eukprot:XP_015655385.1 putative mitochondrial hypothetical protein [Leptomonas pyrrhocoris]
MFKKKVAAQAVAAAVGATTPSTAAPSRRPSAARGAGSKARTLALIEKHRKIVEEAQRQREEMESITAEQKSLLKQRKQLARASATTAAAVSEKAKLVAPPRKAASTQPPAAPSTTLDTDTKPDAFTALIDQFLAATQPLADLDETIQGKKVSLTSSTAADPAEKPSATAPRPARAHRAPVLTHRSFAASLTCPKKFYLFQNRSDLIPKASLGDMMHFDDSVGFNELARRWDRLQFGSRAHVVKESDFDQAVQHTEELIVSYFQGPYASLREQAPTLTIHRPAFAVDFAAPVSGGAKSEATGSSASAPIAELRARPAIIRYRPKEDQWVFIDSQAVIDPVSTSARITHTIQKFHFTVLCFRIWLTQPHLPIELRKKFLQVNLDDITRESLRGRSLESSARPAAPIDLKRSGLLHIRQFFPGPVTLVDCAPPQLMKFIQRISLEELLEEDSRHYGRESGRGHPFSHGFTGGGGGAFDLRNCHSSVGANAGLRNLVDVLDANAQEFSKMTQGRTVRSQKHKDETLHRLFEAQQQFMEELLRQHTLPLMDQQRRLTETAADKIPVHPLTAFSSLLGDEGFVHGSSTSAAAAVGPSEPADDADGAKSKKTVKSAARKVRGGKAKQKFGPAGADGDDGEGAAGEEGVAGGGTSAGAPCYGCYIGPQCLRGGDACSFFVEGMCLPRKVDDPITAKDNHLFTLPSTSLARKSAWWAEGKRTVGDILAAYGRDEPRMRMTQAQLRYAEALTQGLVALNPKEIDAFFAKIRYPLFVIDFEAVQFALPPFQKEIAYQSIPFQFSLDVFQRDVLTEEPTHYNYLHFGKGCSPNTDPRPGCVAELLRIVRLEREKKRAAMEVSGELARLEAEKAAAEAEAEAEAAVTANGRRSRKPKVPKNPKITKATPLEQPLRPYDGSFIAHFASFEKSCLEKLGQLEEEYKEEIKEFCFLDTLDLIKRGCVHPNTHGSNSLKKVLPALCPDFQYGVFGAEKTPSDDLAATGDGGGAAEGQDEQKGENAMGVYRLWYHLEGGGTVQDLQRASRGLSGNAPSDAPAGAAAASAAWTEKVRTTMSKEERDRMWHTLRIQLLEYCSLDTKALYEIMRQIHAERAAIEDATPKDKNGWVFIKPMSREMDL